MDTVRAVVPVLEQLSFDGPSPNRPNCPVPQPNRWRASARSCGCGFGSAPGWLRRWARVRASRSPRSLRAGQTGRSAGHRTFRRTGTSSPDWPSAGCGHRPGRGGEAAPARHRDRRRFRGADRSRGRRHPGRRGGPGPAPAGPGHRRPTGCRTGRSQTDQRRVDLRGRPHHGGATSRSGRADRRARAPAAGPRRPRCADGHRQAQKVRYVDADPLCDAAVCHRRGGHPTATARRLLLDPAMSVRSALSAWGFRASAMFVRVAVPRTGTVRRRTPRRRTARRVGLHGGRSRRTPR